MLISQFAFLFQRAIDNVLELRRQIRIQTNRSDGRAIHDAVEDHARSFSAKRKRPGGHFVEHDSERKQISARIQRLATHLLRRHVSHCA